MKSGTRNIIIVGAVAVLLGGAVFALTKTGGESSGSSSAESSSADIQLISKSSADVASMKVTNKKGSYTLVPLPTNSVAPSSEASSSSATLLGASSAEASSAAETNVSYTVKELTGCPINTGETSSVVQDGFNLSATKNLGTVSNLSDYGLSSPQATVEVTFKDGSTYGYKIGNATATDSSAYYMCGLESDNVYVVSIDDGLLEDATYFVERDMISITANATNSTVQFTKIALSGQNFPTATTLTADEDGKITITEPNAFEADTNNLAALEEALTSVTADSVAAIHPDAAALKKYGLDNPTVKVAFTAEKKDHVLTIGAKNGDNYYAMVDGVDVVYNVAYKYLKDIVSQSLFGLRSKLVFLPNIETVKQIEVTSSGKTDVMNVTRTENTASSTESDKAYDYKITGNEGKSLDYDTNYRNTYQTIISLEVFADTNTVPSETPAVTIKYSYFDKSSQDTVALYQVDDRRYAVVFDGTVCGLCTKNDVETILQTVSDFEAGKSISSPI
jgi:hypothetical protein